MKKVIGGGSEEPGDPNPDFCKLQGKGFIVCVSQDYEQGFNYPYMCCTTPADAQSFCPPGWLYSCETGLG
ncbi:hypothetical protein [Pedobacter montanisoli]|uniref:Uncharacterized protein n=1 Tax=Pedobacter montanisoli TaxID=2923277 RepID=A0ABS9ZY47_9SPHI|nr:hypothetical protein [Pedobacter montanisoli]MCJ0743233.1 hypothetical protein [Pedobacter montanisoli]